MRQAVRGCALEGNPDAAARSVFNDLFGLVVKVVVPQAATERLQGVRWVNGSTRDPPTRQKDAAHDPHRGQHRVDENAEGMPQAGRKENGASREEGEGTKARDVLAY